MYTKRLPIVAVFFCVFIILHPASNCLAEKGWKANSGVAKSSGWRKITPDSQALGNLTYFHINGVKFNWTPIEKNRFCIAVCDGLPKGFCNIQSLDDIDNPSMLTLTKPAQKKLPRPEGEPLSAISCPGYGIVFKIRDDFFIGIEATDMRTAIRFSEKDKSMTIGELMEYKWKAWTWSELSKKTL
ncbi:MAG: hypothetical protein AAB509_00830 [Patescibacteria group bacterium]